MKEVQLDFRECFSWQGLKSNGYWNAFIAVLLLCILGGAPIGCSLTRQADLFPWKWYLIGTDAGRFVFRHDHKNYKAECTATRLSGHPESISHDCEFFIYYLNGNPIADLNYAGDKIEVGSANRKGHFYFVFRVVAVEEGDSWREIPAR